MPTYAYACTACDHRFDAQQSFTDDALTECPQCAGRLRKLFSAVGVVFKGSGFYRTDSRSGAGKGSSSGPDGGSGTSSGTSGGTGGAAGGSSTGGSSTGGSSSGGSSSGGSGSSTTPSKPSTKAAAS